MWRVNYKRLAVFLLLIITGVITALTVSGLKGYLPLLFFIVILLLSFLFFFIQRSGLSFEESTDDVRCVRQSIVNYHVTVSSHTFLPVPAIELHFYDVSGLVSTDHLTEVISLKPHESKIISSVIFPEHIGTFRVGVSGIVIRDLLGILTYTKENNSNIKIVVLPRLYDVEWISASSGAYEYSQNANADPLNSLEYAGVRDYRTGDMMKDINWKLSASGRGLLTKTRESSEGHTMDILVSGSRDIMHRDLIIESAMSLVNFCRSHSIICRLIIPCKGEGVRCITDIPEDLFSSGDYDVDPVGSDGLLREVIDSGLLNQSKSVAVCVDRADVDFAEEISRIQTGRSITVICTSGDISELIRRGINAVMIKNERDISLGGAAA